MAIDPECEVLIHLGDAQQHPLLRQGRHPGKPISYSSIERWITHGVRGVKLEAVKIGATRFTSDGAIRKFIAACQPSTPTQAKREHAAA